MKRSRSNPPVIDPTKNVLGLVKAAMKRQDDLRKAEARRQDNLRNVTTSWRDRLDRADRRSVRSLALAESRRVDGLIVALTTAITNSTEKQAETAATLAKQVQTTAEAMAQQTGTLRSLLEGRLAVVEQNQYQTGGRDIQREKGTERSQWTAGLILQIILGVVAIAGLAASIIYTIHAVTGR